MRGLTTITALAASLLVACGPDDPPVPANVALTSDALDIATQETGLFLSIARAVEATRTGAERLNDALDRADAQLGDFYSRCATVTRAAPGAIRVALRNCPGRMGLRAVTGDLLYEVDLVGAAELRVRARVVSGALRVGLVRITDFDATALLRRTDTTLTLTIERSAYTAFGVYGQYVHREVSAADDAPVTTTINVNNRNCYAFSGTWRVTMGPGLGRARAYRVAVADLRRCFAQCPQPAEDAVTLTDLTPTDGGLSSFVVSFTGGSTAEWTSTNPTSRGVLTLLCSN